MTLRQHQHQQQHQQRGGRGCTNHWQLTRVSGQWGGGKCPPCAGALTQLQRKQMNGAAAPRVSPLSDRLLSHQTRDGGVRIQLPGLTMDGRLERAQAEDESGGEEEGEEVAASSEATDTNHALLSLRSPSSSSICSPLPPSASASASALLALASPATRRSISMGDFRRVTEALLSGSDPPSASATAPSSKLVTPSSSMEFEAARRRLLEVEERQRVIREMERRLEELREVFVQSEQQVVLHGELVTRISGSAQQGELYVAETGQRLKKGLKFKKHRPTIIFSSMLGLRTCLPWPVKLK